MGQPHDESPRHATALAIAGLALGVLTVIGIVLSRRPHAPEDSDAQPAADAHDDAATASTARPLLTAVSTRPVARPVSSGALKGAKP